MRNRKGNHHLLSHSLPYTRWRPAAVFHLAEANGEKVRNPKKLQSIKQMLNVYMQQEEDLMMNAGG